MKERLKALRLALRMTQGAFGGRIGVSQSTVADYERGYRDPARSVLITICREFHVSEDWLHTGKGEMFDTEARDALDDLLMSRGLGDGERALVEQFLALEPEHREIVTRFVVRAAEAIQKAEGTIPKTLEEIFDSEEGRTAFEAGFQEDRKQRER